MTELKNTLTLTLGDWSADGHKETQTFTIRCNLTRDELLKAYKAGEKKTKVKFQDTVADEYEDNFMSVDIVEKLTKHGYDVKEFADRLDDDPRGYSLWTDGYAGTWLFIAKVGNPELEYEFCTDADIHIGGYGLFYG